MYRLIIPAAGVAAYLVYKNQEKDKPPPAPRPKLPWEKDEPCLMHFGSPITRDGTRKGFNLDVASIAERGFTGWRPQCNAPRAVFEMGPVLDWENVPHDWTDQAGPYAKDGKVHLIGHRNEDWFGAQREAAEICLKHGVAFYQTLFDGCGTKSVANNAYAHRQWNDRGWDGGSVDKFFNVNGPFFKSQKQLAAWTMKNIGDLPNVVFELANEPYGNDWITIEWHRQMIAYLAGLKGKYGYDHLKFQVNAKWAEMNGFCEFVAVHTHNDSHGLWDRLHEINPRGYGSYPGKCGRSSDTGSWKNTDPAWWVEHWRRALERRHNCEFLVMDNHGDIWKALAEFQAAR